MKEWTEKDLLSFYKSLYNTYGSQNWWPADTPFETIIGAILAQNVSWNGARNAVTALKNAGLMDVKSLYDSGQNNITPLIRSSRYYNQKAKKIMLFLDFFLNTYEGSVERMIEKETLHLREQLLNLAGFGPETVDSILLYALEKPVFVVDAYTRRIGERQGWFTGKESYEEMQTFFISRIRPDVLIYNDFHAQIVHLGNHVCKKNPICEKCPVKEISSHYKCMYATQ